MNGSISHMENKCSKQSIKCLINENKVSSEGENDSFTENKLLERFIYLWTPSKNHLMVLSCASSVPLPGVSSRQPMTAGY